MAITEKIAYSFPTVTVGVTSSGSTSMVISDRAVVPTINSYVYATLCSDSNFNSVSADYETIKVFSESSGTLSIERAVEGTDKEWPAGSAIRFGGTYSFAQDVKDSANISFNNSTSGLSATTVQDAIDEVDSDLDTHIANTTDAHNIDDYLPLAGGTMSGTIACNDQLITQPDIKDYVETLATATWNSTSASINMQNGNVHKVSITAAVTTLTFTNPRAGAHSFTLILTQDGTGRAITWPAAVDWPGGTAPTINGINEVHVLTFFTPDSGTTWYGFHAGSDMS